MNRYIMIRRLRGPAFLLLVGIIALLNQADILTWGQAWPLFLILLGVLLLAERAALAGYTAPSYPAPGYPGAPYNGTYAQPPAGQNVTGQTGTSIVPAHSDEDERLGGQL